MRWMPNENLTHKLTADELRKGGQKSGEARRAKKSLREAMQVLMDADLTGKDGKTAPLNGEDSKDIGSVEM